jgi:hypothetical protein
MDLGRGVLNHQGVYKTSEGSMEPKRAHESSKKSFYVSPVAPAVKERQSFIICTGKDSENAARRKIARFGEESAEKKDPMDEVESVDIMC